MFKLCTVHTTFTPQPPFPAFAAALLHTRPTRRLTTMQTTDPSDSSCTPTDRPSSHPNRPNLPKQNTAGPNRRSRPPLSYTDDFKTPTSISLDVIGVIHSPYKERFGTPRQPNVTANTLGNCMQPAQLQLFDCARPTLSLRGLAEFEYVWIVSYFHLNQGFAPLVTPPRGPRKKQGVFATRSPHRPNSIGLSCIRITGVDVDAGLVHLLGVDLLDGTAVLDIKPYIPYCDAFPSAKAGWLDKLNEDMKAPDVLTYDPPPAHLMRAVSLADTDTSTNTVSAPLPSPISESLRGQNDITNAVIEEEEINNVKDDKNNQK